MDIKDENKKTNQGAPQATGQSSVGDAGSTSKQAPKTYTEEEVKILTEKVRSDVLAEAGRKYKPVEDENSTLKSQLATNQTLIKSTEDKIAKLQTEIDEMAADNPDGQKYLKKLRELQAAELQLKTDRQSLEADANEVKVFKRNKLINEMAKDYDGVDTARLTSLCEKLNLTTNEQIQTAAESMGTKKPAAAAAPALNLKVDSGVTDGGGTDIEVGPAGAESLAEHPQILFKSKNPVAPVTRSFVQNSSR